MTVRLRNPDSRWTLHELDVRPPPTVRLDPAGIPVCGEAAALELRCEARTGGAGRALVTAAGDPSRVTTYAVALVRLDARGALGLRFSTPSGQAHLTPATLRTISGRQRLRFRLPPAVVGTDGAYASLRSLRVRLGAERRGRAFVSVQGCRRRAHRFRARARFLENGLTPDARVDVRRAAACR